MVKTDTCIVTFDWWSKVSKNIHTFKKQVGTFSDIACLDSEGVLVWNTVCRFLQVAQLDCIYIALLWYTNK